MMHRDIDDNGDNRLRFRQPACQTVSLQFTFDSENTKSSRITTKYMNYADIALEIKHSFIVYFYATRS